VNKRDDILVSASDPRADAHDPNQASTSAMPADKPAAIRFAIFDNHAAMREVMARALVAEGSFLCIGGGGSADEAVACGQDLLPDIIVTDMQMPGGGLDAIRRLYVLAPFVKVVVLSSDDSEHLVSACLSAGAFGFLTKGQPLRTFIRDLKAIARGESQFSAGLARTLVSAQGVASPWLNTLVETEGPSNLAVTPREQQILSRFAQGLTIGEIASAIGVSQSTVTAFLTNILLKLHERTLCERVDGSSDF
jgi:two-component system, NarL family, nitrate/nitrite response regulator NarL